MGDIIPTPGATSPGFNIGGSNTRRLGIAELVFPSDLAEIDRSIGSSNDLLDSICGAGDVDKLMAESGDSSFMIFLLKSSGLSYSAGLARFIGTPSKVVLDSAVPINRRLGRMDIFP